MNSIQDTLNRYSEGNPDQRLGLFLFHRDLREEFGRIELAEAEETQKQMSKMPSRSRFQSLADSVWGWIKAKGFQVKQDKRSTGGKAGTFSGPNLTRK